MATEPVAPQQLAEQLEPGNLSLRSETLAVEVRDDDSLMLAQGLGHRLKERLGQVEAAFAEPCAKAHAAWKAAIALRDQCLRPLKEAYDWQRSQIGAYVARKERERLAEEARLRELERKRAEEEALAAAIAAEKAGDAKLAEAIIEAPVTTRPVVLPPTTPKLEGISQRTTWRARVVDEAAVPREYLMVDDKKLQSVARATRGSVAIAGVEFYPEHSAAFR